VASHGNASALTPGTLENRIWEKSWATLETRQAGPLQTTGLHQENGSAGYDFAPDSLLAAKGGTTWTARDFVQEVATRAEKKIGGTGAVPGTEKHAYAAELIDRYQSRFGPVGGGLATEQSYLGGAHLGRSINLPGSVRLDVVEGAVTSPSAVFDFKFTINPNPVLSPTRINDIRINAGLSLNVPIQVVHP